MPPVSPSNIADEFPVTSLHAIVVHGGRRSVAEVEAWVQETLMGLLPRQDLSSERVVGHESHTWTPEGFPQPVNAHGLFLKSDRDNRIAVTLNQTIRTQLRDAFCREHPTGSLILLARCCFLGADVANLALCHPHPDEPDRGTWVTEPMSEPYLPPSFDGTLDWKEEWFKPEVMEAVLNVFIERRVLSHWGPLLAPAREKRLSAALQKGKDPSAGRPRF